ncbi:aspartyl protease family protein At5g10770-like [Malania oleifera]|uniref:aspartyl protease family protein At5g10770-like n=1 Tax=Malania oleifera TaxID=397392 RepID=UPI0025AE4392|nr:aspartyl protease family protein At5g10770-like [Malania oleifera]
MATIICSNSFLSFLLHCLLIVGLELCFYEKGYGVEGRPQAVKSHQLHHPHAHLLHLSSLLPSSVCKPSTKGIKNGASLKLVHRHGPCSQLSQNPTPSLAQALAQDQSRVDSIHSKLTSPGDNFTSSDATLPATSGRPLGTGNYVVTVGLGTPKSDLILAFDTGSDLTWTQCQPCPAKSCYNQTNPLFNPSASASYSNTTCNSTACKKLASATSKPPGCSASTCVYTIVYGDQSYSQGWFATDTLTLSPSDVFPGFQFGCGKNNNGLFGETSGLLGLGRNDISVVSQTAQKYGRVFSYCLPSAAGSTGHLTFGTNGGGFNSSVKFTPLTANSRSSFHSLGLVGISVGGQKLSIAPTVFSSSGTIIDSGTVITRLPPTAYAALRSAFRQKMSNYTLTDPYELFDTCYDLSKYDTVSVPTVSLLFGGGTEVPVDALGTLLGPSTAQLCLAFAGNKNDNEVGIFGNLQQVTYDVVYDVAGGKVGFGAGGCD